MNRHLAKMFNLRFISTSYLGLKVEKVLHRNRCLHQSLAFRITVILARQVYAVTSCVNHYAYRCLFHLPFCEIFLSVVGTLSKVYGILDSAQCQFHLCLAWEHRAGSVQEWRKTIDRNPREQNVLNRLPNSSWAPIFLI